MAGGLWEFDLGDDPAPMGGVGMGEEDWPVSDWTLGDEAFVAAPFIHAPRSYSGDSLAVTVGCIDEEVRVLHRVVESRESAGGPFAPVEGPVVVEGTQAIQLVADKDGRRSAVVSGTALPGDSTAPSCPATRGVATSSNNPARPATRLLPRSR